MEEFLKLFNYKPDPGTSIIIASILVPLLMYCKGLPGAIYNQIMRMVTIAMVVDETDNMAGTMTFQSLNDWICKNRIQWLTRVFEIDRNRKIVAGVGFNIFLYKGRFFWCVMGRKEPSNSIAKIKSIGTYTLYTFKWNRPILEDLIQVSCKPVTSGFEGRLNRLSGSEVNCLTRYPSYMKTQKQLLSKETYEYLSGIFEKFTTDPDSYAEKERPHKETILLYGPPGTGKTNLIRHLAAKYNLDLISVSPEDVMLDTFTKRSWQSSYYDDAYTVYLVEDIDSNKALLQDQKPDQSIIINSDSDGQAVKGTLSEMLNALDGAVPLDRCIVVLTTNHPDKLEKAIYRAGRVDHHINMDYVTYETALDFLQWDKTDARALVLKANSEKLHAATISQLVFTSTPEEVLVLLKGGEISTTLAKSLSGEGSR